MAYEWVAPVATAAVGVTGVVFTYLTGREGRQTATSLAEAQRSHAQDDRLRDEKREAYTAYLEAASNARHALLRIALLRGDGSRVAETRELRSSASAELNHRREQVRLVGSPGVREMARLHFGNYLEAFKAQATGGPIALDRDLEGALVAHLKRDLGHELAPQDEALLTYVPPSDAPNGPGSDDPAADSPRTGEGP